MIFIIAIVIFLAVTLFGYLVHRALHQPWARRLADSHLVHHLEKYPVTDYMSDAYRSAGKHSTFLFFVIASAPIVCIPIIIYYLGYASLSTAIFVVAEMLIVGWLHDYIHDAFHINNHLLTKLPIIKNWFSRLAKLHYIHHEDMSKNFGIFSMFWDKIFNTYES